MVNGMNEMDGKALKHAMIDETKRLIDMNKDYVDEVNTIQEENQRGLMQRVC